MEDVEVEPSGILGGPGDCPAMSVSYAVLPASESGEPCFWLKALLREKMRMCQCFPGPRGESWQ